jgi:hypothetical protein
VLTSCLLTNLTVVDKGLNTLNEVVSCVYIKAFGNGQLIKRTIVDSEAVVKLISPNLVKKLGIEPFLIKRKWSLKLANNVLVLIRHYTVLEVVVSKIRTILCAYIIRINKTYNLLLSKS